MPEYVLDMGDAQAARAFRDLPAFVQGYIEAMFFTAPTGDSDGEEDLTQASFGELAPETLAGIISDCERFIASLPRDDMGRNAIDLACDYVPRHYDETYAGHDFWYTRNHHGVGFWDRGLGPTGDELTTVAHAFGEADLYRGDDGLLYLM